MSVTGFSIHPRATCRICGATPLETYLDLTDQPPSNSFIAPEELAQEKRFPLQVALCTRCGFSQLNHIVASDQIFDDYLYLSSTSRALCNHYQTLIDQALARFNPAQDALAVDIGCNDGIMLKRYPAGRCRLLGIEPSSAGRYAREAGFEVVDAFFDSDLANRIVASHGSASIITATNVFAHVDDIASFAGGIARLLAPQGVYIIEFPYARDMIDRLYFDTIYHEHLSYLSLTPLERLFTGLGLRSFHVERAEIGASGPALRLFVCLKDADHATSEAYLAMRAEEEAWGIDRPERYRDFAQRVGAFRQDMLKLIADLRGQGAKIGAMGAPAKGNTMLNYLGLGPGQIPAVAENNDLKVGKLTPGSHIPIVSDEEFLKMGFTHALLLTWNYADFFLKNSAFVKQGGKFILPFPQPHVAP
ncbi:MAG: class I SAM-dependent methyltransferase [Alphaproteobacteria bacterium]|nr:class I SAM-dependent methyltransferase [Alphaproteobacteria bacterium]